MCGSGLVIVIVRRRVGTLILGVLAEGISGHIKLIDAQVLFDEL